MIDLMNCETKEEEIRRFFMWLFDKDNIELKSEIDLSLARDYMDPNIYYPAEIEKFFQTKAMKRLAKISQLGEVMHLDKYCYQSRLEHSKGTYYKKLEELIFLCQDESFRNYIENNNMKLYLIAELIKEAGHDIGHPPLSHGMEEQVIGRRGVHEDIGKRILMEDEEIRSVLEQIDKDLPEIFYESLQTDILNSRAHDESNYDVDRMDYLNRDFLYKGERISFHNQPYRIVYAKLDENGNIQKNDDNSIVLADEDEQHKKRIDVYENSSLPEIEFFLKHRMRAYKDIYCHPESVLKSICNGLFVKELMKSDLQEASELKKFISNIQQSNVNDVDINGYMDWNELRLYKEYIKVAQESKDKNFQDLACMSIPTLESLMYFTFSGLEIHNKVDRNCYTPEEAEFIRIIKQLIDGNDEFSKNMRNSQFYDLNCKWTDDPIKIEYLKDKWGDKINCTETKIKGYNNSIPIYVKDKEGKIFEITDNPDCTIDWDRFYKNISSASVLIPVLRIRGVSEDEIEEIVSDFNSQDYGGQVINDSEETQNKGNGTTRNCTRLADSKKTINMSPVQADSSVEKYFKGIEI